MWYGVQNMSKYDVDIKVQPLSKIEKEQIEQDWNSQLFRFMFWFKWS